MGALSPSPCEWDRVCVLHYLTGATSLTMTMSLQLHLTKEYGNLDHVILDVTVECLFISKEVA